MNRPRIGRRQHPGTRNRAGPDRVHSAAKGISSKAGMHNGFGERHEGFRDRRGVFIGGLGFGYYGYPYGWDYSPDYGYSGYSQPYSSQNWYYCSDPAGYYPYVTQCNTGWQAVPAN